MDSINLTSSASESMDSTISSNSEPPRLRWDVFVSFRGPDTRTGFISHLYTALDRNGIRTFKDKPELPPGEVITDALNNAIKESKTYVVVFSQNYAHSSWCLDELVEIYKYYQQNKRLVVGVYYNIDPSVVRHQKGIFQTDFENHDKRYAAEKEKVNEWRNTLKKVADFSGLTISEKERSDEADVIDEIVDVILRKINPKTLPVAKYPVGLVPRVNHITSLLSNDTEGVIKIGLHGLGGVGKTTLAKALYNQFLPERFEGSCFLANVREAWGRPNGIVVLQQQLLDDVLKSKKRVEVHNDEEGTMLIKERICSAKVMCLIDDIDNLKQYESLVGPFASGSVVIITTRDEEMLEKIKVKPKYRFSVDMLDDTESLALFTQHAFGNAKLDNTLTVFFKDILSLAGGLPIALEVFGGYLSTVRSEDGWNSYIQALLKNPDSTIMQKFEISLDALKKEDNELKEIFLDIACFFTGMDIKEVVNIIGTYYMYVDHKISILKRRCLITISDRDQRLRMHDLLRDVGRKVVRNKSDDEPGEHSRLWVSKDICQVLKKHKGTKAIEGIIPSNFYRQDALEGVSYAAKTFKMMSKLRFLYLNKVNLSGSFEQTFEKLTWLRWDCYPRDYLPSEFCPKELVTLALRSSKIKTMWKRNKVPQVFENLKTIDMSYSLNLTTTPDFTKFPCLETLDLEGCTRLKEADVSIGSLVRLVSLNLGGCVKLRSLPNSICNLIALTSLNIGGCSMLLESLTEVNKWGLTVWKLPTLIGRLSRLVELNPLLRTHLSSLTHTHWNVFISFRGIDTQETFHHCLYEALDLSVSVYMDNPEARCRDVISHVLPRAIHQSKIYVVVFSEDYADSERCLDELVEILRCYKSMDRSIIPVYYNIDPSVVRDQTGSFKEAFERHEISFAGEMEKVNKWRLALKKVARMSTGVLYTSATRNNIRPVDLVVDMIFEVIDSKLCLKVGT